MQEFYSKCTGISKESFHLHIKKTLFSQENHKNKIEKNLSIPKGTLVLIAIINSGTNWWVFFIYLIQKRRLKRDSYYGLHAIANMQKTWKRHRRIADLKPKPSHDNAPNEDRGIKNIISIYPESLPPLSKTNAPLSPSHDNAPNEEHGVQVLQLRLSPSKPMPLYQKDLYVLRFKET
jgi:hypothetical protein